jgi:hypothetical protein
MAAIGRRAGWVLGVSTLLACGGRNLDLGDYEDKECSVGGTTFPSGEWIGEPCVCYCDHGRAACDGSCPLNASGGSGGNSGNSAGGYSGTLATGAYGGSYVTGGSYGYGGTSYAGTYGVGGSYAGTYGVGGSYAGTYGVGGSYAGSYSTGGYGATGAYAGTGVAGTGVAGSYAAGGYAAGGYGAMGAYAGTGVGGSAGIAGTAGVAGTSGTVCTMIPRATGTNPLLDDFKDGDSAILFNEGRQGTWYSYNDGSGMQYPASGTLPMSYLNNQWAAYTNGGGFIDWGAGIGFTLNYGCPYDASVYHGIYFTLGNDTYSSLIYVQVLTQGIVPTSAGGTCNEATGLCYDAYQFPLSLAEGVGITAVPFNTLAQAGWGQYVPFDPKTITSIQFQVAAGSQFAFYVGSVSFY